MLRATLHFALGAAVFATSICAGAMGFGRSATRTSLGQPLDFAASIELDADEAAVQRECVFADVYSGDTRIAPAEVRVVLEPAREAGQRSVRVTTAVRIDEPVVTIEVSIGCVSRLSRRFVAFIDPPLLRLAETSGDDVLPPLTPRLAPLSQDLADIARSADASRRRATHPGAADRPDSARRPAEHAARANRVAGSSTQASAKPRSRVASRTPRPLARTALVAAPGAGVPRLRLDPPVAADLPRTAASAPGPAAPALPVDAATTLAIAPLAVAAAASDVLQRERDRIQVLEAGLVSLRSDTQATRQTIAALQARLRQAEGERYANGLVYALAGVALLFALIAAALWWLRPRQRARARWFEAQARAARAAQRKDLAPAAAAPAPPSEPPPAWTTRPASVLGATAPAAIGGLEVTTMLGPQFARPTPDPFRPSGFGALPKKTGELSMEELIDLEQQAEFFVVLGQDEAAISLLDSYTRGDGGKSPLPYLQLLEIHQRRGEQVAYERVRQAFNDRFNAHAPEWSSDLHFGRALVDYPQTIARLQSLWPTPLSAMQALDNLLFRRHSAEDAFDFPAYRELLFLYSIARELSGHVETDFGSIDLFLPLEDAPPAKQAAAAPADSGPFAVDLDVSNWPEDATMSDLLIRRPPRQRGSA
jgi:pilus assembly protein FimV